MKTIFILCILALMMYPQAYAAQIPQGQDVGSRVRDYENEKTQERMNRELANPMQAPPAIDEAEVGTIPLPDDASSIFVNKIIVQKGPGVDKLVADKRLAEFAGSYEAKTLSVEDMKAVADSAAEYFADNRLKAYVPRQSFSGGIMYINLILGEPPKK